MNRVLLIPVSQFGEGANVIYSASKRDMKDTLGEFCVKNHFSFCFINGDYAAEWEPEYGPIQVWHKCDKDSENAKENYIFEFTDTLGGSWSQLAVNNNWLPQSANTGDWEHIFAVLKRWARE